MTKRDKIKLEILEELVKEVGSMWPESILPHIEDEIDILKHGI